MKLGNRLNYERVQTLQTERNAYVMNMPRKENLAQTQSAEKVIFRQPYENANPYYNKNEFCKPIPPEPPKNPPNNNMPMFDIKSILPMLMSGKFDMLKPLLSMFGGGGEMSKIFELFKPKNKPKKENDEDSLSKFEDYIIIED